MIQFSGNTSNNASSPMYNLPFVITFFKVANKNAGSTTINIYVQTGSQQISIVPQNLVLSQGDMLQGTLDEDLIEANSQIIITTSASIDYKFTLKNTQAGDDTGT